MPGLIKKIKNMIELVDCEEDELKEYIGHKNAKAVKSFLETKVNIGGTDLIFPELQDDNLTQMEKILDAEE